MTQSIPLAGKAGAVALVDDEDYPLVSQFKWYYHNSGYAFQSFKDKDGRQVNILLHRFILDAPDHLFVDHKNFDGLDCRRSNLRLCTKAQNRQNIRPMKNNQTGLKGVTRIKTGFVARIKAAGKLHHLGTFHTAEAAARAYDRAAAQYFGEFAWLNFPEQLSQPGMQQPGLF